MGPMGSLNRPIVFAPVSTKILFLTIKNPHIESISGVKNLGRQMIQKDFLDPIVNLKWTIKNQFESWNPIGQPWATFISH